MTQFVKRRLSVEETTACIKANYSLQSMSNFIPTTDFFNALIGRECYFIKWKGHFVLVHSDDGFSRFFFMLLHSIQKEEMDQWIQLLIPELSELKTEKIVCEYVSKTADRNSIDDFLMKLGFEPFIARERMRLHRIECSKKKENESNGTVILVPEDAQLLLDHYKAIFDPYTSLIPSLSELERTLRDGRVIGVKLADEEDRTVLAGALEYSIDRKTSTIMHVFVADRFRGKGLSRILLEKYLYDIIYKNNLRALLWVKCDNAAAKHLYKKYGYAEDQLYAKSYLFSR